MKKKSTVALVVSLLLSIQAVPLAAKAQGKPLAATTRQTYAYVFRDAEIAMVAEEILGQGLGLSYRLDPKISGRMNFRIEQRLTKAQLLAAFEAALANFDIVLLNENDILVLKPRDKAQIGGTISTNEGRPKGIGYQIRAVPINYGLASEISKLLETITKSDVVLFSSDKLNLILLGGRAEELDNALGSIALFDQSTLSEAQIRFFALSSGTATTVAADLEKVLKGSGTLSVTVAAMTRLNAIVAFSKSKDALDQLANWVQKLDTPSSDPSLKIFVYRPRGRSSEALAETLNRLTGLKNNDEEASQAVNASTNDTDRSSVRIGQKSGGVASQAANKDLFSIDGQMAFLADKDTNTLIINAPTATRVRIMDILNDIDREPAQVFIEASILEVTLTKDFSYGIDWKAIASDGELNGGNYTSSDTSFSSIAPGFSINYVGSDISAAITALSSFSKVRIVSAPKISTIENNEAVLQIGDQVPITRQTSQSTTNADSALVSTVEYKDTGVVLKVTPRISSQDRIWLNVSQEVSSVSKTTTSGIDSPTINKREIQTKLILPEGAVVALGGLISSSTSDGNRGIPFIQNIPVLGYLFKGKSISEERRELVVLLQAHIIRNDQASASLLSSLNEDLKEMMRTGSFYKWP
jgi:general secretion pathway protein D